MTTASAKKPVFNDEDAIESLRAKIAELENLLKKGVAPVEEDETKIALDEYIPVMSLLPYTLVLSTQAMGRGITKRFEKFGEIKKILYKDLVDMMEISQNFMKSGFYYILDQRVIRAHGLDEYYDKILTKEKIEEIMQSDAKSGLELYKSANPGQQKVIVGLLIEKMVENPNAVDMNLVDSISRESDVNITERVQFTNALNEHIVKKP